MGDYTGLVSAQAQLLYTFGCLSRKWVLVLMFSTALYTDLVAIQGFWWKAYMGYTK